MTDIQAALGIHQLAKIEKHWRRRKEIWDHYNHELAHLPIDLPAPIGAHEKHAHHLYTILVDEKRTGISRDEFLNEMTQKNIGLGVHYLRSAGQTLASNISRGRGLPSVSKLKLDFQENEKKI